MNHRSIRLAVRGAILALFVLMAGPAQAEARPYSSFHLEAPASNGYRVVVDAQNSPEGAAIYFIRGEAPSFEIGYARASYVTRHRIRVNYPGFGRINLGFEGKETTRIDLCEGEEGSPKMHRARRGIFKGTLEFVTGEGISEVSLGRVPGTAARIPRNPLQPSPWCGSREPLHGVFMRVFNPLRPTATVPPGIEDIEVRAEQRVPGDPVAISALVSQFRSGVGIYRSLELEADASALSYPDDGSSAILAPPAPFEGSGTFTRLVGEEPDQFTGDLVLKLPGLGPLPVASPDAHASLQRYP